MSVDDVVQQARYNAHPGIYHGWALEHAFLYLWLSATQLANNHNTPETGIYCHDDLTWMNERYLALVTCRNTTRMPNYMIAGETRIYDNDITCPSGDAEWYVYSGDRADGHKSLSA